MAQLKTQPTDADVGSQPRCRAHDAGDANHLAAIMTELTGAAGHVWGPSVSGLRPAGITRIRPARRVVPRPASRRARPAWCSTPMVGFDPAVLDKLGPHTTEQGLPVHQDLRAVDEAVLREIITASLEES